MALTLSPSQDRRSTRLDEAARFSASAPSESMPKVLIVDDEEIKRGALVTALRRAGFDAHGVSSGEAAREIAQGAFEVAIVDLMLHGTNGFDLARRVRATSPSVRVVLTSAYHFTEVQLARIDCGAVGFVPQPFAMEELTSFLRAKLA